MKASLILTFSVSYASVSFSVLFLVFFLVLAPASILSIFLCRDFICRWFNPWLFHVSLPPICPWIRAKLHFLRFFVNFIKKKFLCVNSLFYERYLLQRAPNNNTFQTDLQTQDVCLF